ncbi:hypothetical protein ABIB57_000918 [Devosia sp. UYZn731]|uniref:alpha-glutamyl/putrescinyl thymine pyrophosphorylase clade 3 protein n=1 Tax=Devosia sp. UYZn731 TaxID=3156345 RepID=UPI00339B5EB1
MATTKGIHRNQAAALMAGLATYEAQHGALPGIVQPSARQTLIEQMISSLRRIEYIRAFPAQKIAAIRLEPHSEQFDPLKGAYLLGQKGAIDEAVWMTFVATHFGKHAVDGWKLAANVMGSFGGVIWTFDNYGAAPADFEAMLHAHQADLTDPAISGRYSNHRQYQSKSADIIATVFSTFNSWLVANGDFVGKVRSIHQQVGQEPTLVFRALYRSMRTVYGFGRLGNFDFLTMLSKLQLAPIEADSVHLSGATGPLAGARLLIQGNGAAKKPKEIEAIVDDLDTFLNVGKQVLEDSLCNWQKSPNHYVYFKG